MSTLIKIVIIAATLTVPSVATRAANDAVQALFEADPVNAVAILSSYGLHCAARDITPFPPEKFMLVVAGVLAAQGIDRNDQEFKALVLAKMSLVDKMASNPDVLNQWCHKISDQMNGK
jgi:hypothetical protein